MDLQNKVVVVTGGASGLGLVTCQELAKKGAKIVAFDLNEDAGVSTVLALLQVVKPLVVMAH